MQCSVSVTLVVIVVCCGAFAGDHNLMDADSISIGAEDSATESPLKVTCDSPEIIDPVDSQTLVAKRCNKLDYKCEAHPGGVGRNGQIEGWNVSCPGCDCSMDKYGHLELRASEPGIYTVKIEAKNDCSPPLTDEITVYVTVDGFKITNLSDGDTLYTNHCGALRFRFKTNHNPVYISGWEVLTSYGDISDGIYYFHETPIGSYHETVEVTAICMPPLKDTVEFIVKNEGARADSSNSAHSSWLDSPSVRSEFVYGPEGAESLSVHFEMIGSTAEVEAAGISFRASPGKNRYSSILTLEEYHILKSLCTVVLVRPERRQSTKYESDPYIR